MERWRGEARRVAVERVPDPDDRLTAAYQATVCPYCGCTDSRVVRSAVKVTIRVRIHICRGCSWAYRSIETAAASDTACPRHPNT